MKRLYTSLSPRTSPAKTNAAAYCAAAGDLPWANASFAQVSLFSFSHNGSTIL